MPHALTIIAEIKRERGDEEHQLRVLLDHHGRSLKNSTQLQFHKMKTVHYAAWLIIPRIGDYPARLMLETNYDGKVTNHLDDLIEHAAPALDEIYALCEKYPGNAKDQNSRVQIIKFFKTHRVATSAYFVGLPHRSVEDIRNAICVYQEARDYLQKLDADHLGPREIEANLVEHVSGLPENKRPRRFKITQRRLKWRLAFNLARAAVVLLLLLLLPPAIGWYLNRLWLGYLALPLPLYIIGLFLLGRYQEIREQRAKPAKDPTAHAESFGYVNVGLQNHMCTLATVKPGWFRRFMIRQVLLFARFLNTQIFLLGKLNQVPTVHFARWTLIDDDRQLVFLGNFDGNWAAYLSDFSDGPRGVNLVWGNTVGFPPTRFLVGDGCRDLEAFEEQAMTHFVAAPVFYAAYEGYSVRNLLRYVEFRDELARLI